MPAPAPAHHPSGNLCPRGSAYGCPRGSGPPPPPRGSGVRLRPRNWRRLRETFPFYPAAVTGVLALEPDPTLRALARTAAAGAPVPVTVQDGVAEALPAADGSIDVVVSSLVLCSVPDQSAALAEAVRVLRHGRPAAVLRTCPLGTLCASGRRGSAHPAGAAWPADATRTATPPRQSRWQASPCRTWIASAFQHFPVTRAWPTSSGRRPSPAHNSRRGDHVRGK